MSYGLLDPVDLNSTLQCLFEPRKPVDAHHILLVLILHKGIRSVFSQPDLGGVVHLTAASLEVHKRDTIAARVCDPFSLHADHSASGRKYVTELV